MSRRYAIVSEPGTDRQTLLEDFLTLRKALQRLSFWRQQGTADVMRRLEDGSLSREI